MMLDPFQDFLEVPLFYQVVLAGTRSLITHSSWKKTFFLGGAAVFRHFSGSNTLNSMPYISGPCGIPTMCQILC